VVADGVLEPVQTTPAIAKPTAIPSDGRPFVGQDLTLYGATTWSEPIVAPGQIVLQVSSDNRSWSDVSGAALWASPQQCRAVLPIDGATLRYYRFYVPPSEFVDASASPPFAVTPRENHSSWSGVLLLGTGLTQGTPAVGESVSFVGTLRGLSGATEAGITPIVEYSTDGVAYTPVPGASVARLGGGTYRATIIATGRRYYRFSHTWHGFSRPLASSSILLTPPAAVTINCSVSGVRYPRTFVLSGLLAPGVMRDPCVVEVRKPGSKRWSYSSARLVHQIDSAGRGSWWYRYAPKLRGLYSFRVRSAGSSSRSACLSRTITVKVK
jgi:hypothetical protein